METTIQFYYDEMMRYRAQRDRLLVAAKAVLALPLDWGPDPEGEVFHELEWAVKECEQEKNDA